MITKHHITSFFQTIFGRNFDKTTQKGRWEIGLLVVGILACVRAAAMGAGDFAVYFHAAAAIWRGDSVYLSPFLLAHGNSLAFSYPMFWAFLLIPFTILPLWAANFLWLFLNLVLVSKIVDLLNYFLDFQYFTQKQKNLFYFLTLLFSLRFLLYNFDMSQVTIGLVWLLLTALKWLDERRWWAAGALIGFGVNVKIMPIVLIPYLIWRGFYKSFFFSILFCILFFFSPKILMSWNLFWSHQSDFWATVNPSNVEFTSQQNAEAEGLHSLSAAFFAFLYDDGFYLKNLKRNIVSLDAKMVNFYLNLARLFLVGLTLYFVRLPKMTPPSIEPQKRRISAFWELSYLALVVPLIFPHQQKYAFFMLLPAWAYLLYFGMNLQIFAQKTTKTYVFWAFLSLIWILTTGSTDGIVGKSWYQIGQFYKLITWGAVFTIGILMWATPRKLATLLNQKTI